MNNTQRVEECHHSTTTPLRIWEARHDDLPESKPPTPSCDQSPIQQPQPPTFSADQVAALMAALQAGTRPQVQMTATHLPQKTITSVIQPYWDWASVNRSPKTVSRMQTSWAQLIEYGGRSGSCPMWSDFSVALVYAWTATLSTLSPTTIAARITDLRTVCSWLVTAKLIQSDPLVGVKKPTVRHRSTYVTWEVHQRLMAELKPDSALRALLTLAWETGGRPQELRPLEARHVDLSRRCLLIPRSEAKGRRRDRMIYLSPTAMELVTELLQKTPEGPLFVTKQGTPFTSSGLCHRMAKLKKTLGLPSLCLTEYRHGFAHRLLAKDVPIVTVSEAMGHANTTMVSTVYGHHSENRNNMLRAVGW